MAIQVRKKRLALGLAAALSIQGCGTYNATSEPLEAGVPVGGESAYLSVPYITDFRVFGLATTYISRVDDEYIGSPDSLFWTTTNNAVLQPGRHRIGVHYKYGAGCWYALCIVDTEKELTINFDAEAGHKYQIHVEREDEHYTIWIEDERDNSVIAWSRHPSESPTTKILGKSPEDSPSLGSNALSYLPEHAVWNGEWSGKDGAWSLYLDISSSTFTGRLLRTGSGPFYLIGTISSDSSLEGHAADERGAPTVSVSGTLPIVSVYWNGRKQVSFHIESRE